LVVLLAGFTVTGGVAWLAQTNSIARDRARFENVVLETGGAISARMEIYIGLLRATAGLMNSGRDVSREVFLKFVQRIDPENRYPGVQGIGFAQQVRPEGRESTLTRMKAEGYSQFAISPPGEREEYFPIAYLEPEDRRNLQAIGYDMFSEPTRRAAMIRARDQGEPALSGRVTLVQEIDAEKQAGFLIYVPVYRSSDIPATIEARRREITGFAYSPFRAGDLFHGILGLEANLRAHFEIYDGETVDPKSRLFRSSPDSRPASQFVDTRRLRIADREWTVRYFSTPVFEAASTIRWTPLLAAAGISMSFLFAGITLALARAETEARRRGQIVQAQREELQVTLESIGDAVVSTDAQGCVVFMNNVAERLLGCRLSDVRQRRLSEIFSLVNEDSGSPIPDPVSKVLNTGEVSSMANHTTLVARDGRRIAIEDCAAPIKDENGKLRGAVLVFQDVTARRRAERELQDREQQLRAAVERLRFMAESMPQKIFAAGPGGETDYFNRQWMDFSGLALDQLRGWGWVQFVHPSDVEEYLRQWRHSLKTGEHFQMEHRVRRHDRVYRWHLSRAHALREASGAIVMWIGSTTDIEDQKRAEERLELTVAERTAALRESNEQLEALVYSIAHDLRSPLRAITGYAQLLAEDHSAGLNKEAQHLLDRVRASAESMDRLILDLLAFGRTARAALEFSRVEVSSAWTQALEQNSRAIESSGARVETTGSLPAVRAHEQTLVQALANLLSNALKFVDSAVKPHVRFWAEERGEKVRLWVGDNGIGIRPELHARAFRVFERFHGHRYEGTGIGLAIVRKGVERMGGSVGLESGSEKGTRFWIELPRADPQDSA
jgi:PAS domain S-box-containing protein